MTYIDSSRPPSGAFFRVESEEQARLLSDPVKGAFIHPFLGKECSVAEAAKTLSCSVQTMHYRVRQLLVLGLVEVTREEKRAGRPIKYYQAVSNAFFIPDDLTKHADLEERLLADLAPTVRLIAEGLAKAIKREGRTGRCEFYNEHGSISSYGCVEKAEDNAIELNYEYPFRLPNTDRRGDIFLTDDEARQLSRELNALFGRYLKLRRKSPTERRKEFTFLYALVSN